jgi:hypothetical protein
MYYNKPIPKTVNIHFSNGDPLIILIDYNGNQSTIFRDESDYYVWRARRIRLYHSIVCHDKCSCTSFDHEAFLREQWSDSFPSASERVKNWPTVGEILDTIGEILDTR